MNNMRVECKTCRQFNSQIPNSPNTTIHTQVQITVARIEGMTVAWTTMICSNAIQAIVDNGSKVENRIH